MNIKIISVGNKMPDWITTGYYQYAKRLPSECNLILHEIPLYNQAKIEEKKILSAIGKKDYVIAMEITGTSWSTAELTIQLQKWLTKGCNICLLIGGPDGIQSQISIKAHQTWSLSPLTLPHFMTRIIIAEQIYRAWSIIHHHPYHRR